MSVQASGNSCDGLPLLDALEILAFNPNFIDPNLPSGLWFCDCAQAASAVSINAVCLRSTASWADLPRCKDFFQAFPYIVIVSPDPEMRHTMTGELRRRIPGKPFYVATDKSFRGCQSVQELRDTHGLKGVQQILLDAVELPIYGLLDIADVKRPDVSSILAVPSGFPPLDKKIGGFRMGELSVWTGRRGEGKSTLLGQLLNESVDHNFRVCAYSGELSAWQFKYWTSLQAAGPDNLIMAKDPRTGKVVPSITEAVQNRIDDWWRRRFMLYDIGASAVHDAENILRLFQYANNAYGCNVFLVDNIMTARFKTGKNDDFYRAQSNFVVALAGFARRARVHVHLVAHPRKAPSGSKKHLENDDVGGIGDITNLADNVFSLERSVRKGEDAKREEDVTELAILKNRMWGDLFPRGSAMRLDFDRRSKRYYRDDDQLNRHYGWDVQEQISLEDLEGSDPDLPFEQEGK